MEAYDKMLKQSEKLLVTIANNICWDDYVKHHPIVNIVDGTTGNFIDGDWIESKDQAKEGIRLLQLADIGDGVFLDKSERFVSQETFRRLKCTEVFPGDILVSRMADPIGRACIVPKTGQKMITAVDCTIIRINENKHDKRYWLYLCVQTVGKG